MGFLDQLLTGIESGKSTQQGAQGGTDQPQKGAALMDQVSQMISQAGGIGGLVEQFKQKGLGDMISAWIGTGANPSISEEQIVRTVGQDRIRSIASAVGMSDQQVTASISKLLPVIIDKLTPGGKVSQTPGETEKSLSALKSKFLGS